ncbi:MAG: DUF1674 domain-containing protein [Gammaproteobacteria bacterium]|nr:DUF1674 domain-containing protein [Gammaproteobacteria bacterium]
MSAAGHPLPQDSSGAQESTPVARRTAAVGEAPAGCTAPQPREVGGPQGPEPTRYGDWERRGRCIDF